MKMDQMGRKLSVSMDNVGNKIDAKLAVKELKTGLKEMKRENPAGWKKELKGLKHDLKQQMREVKRESKRLKREARYHRRDARRNYPDGARCGERRTRGCEGTEYRDWDAGGVRPDGQVTGVTQTQTQDPNHLESAKGLKA